MDTIGDGTVIIGITIGGTITTIGGTIIIGGNNSDNR
jgi:hypothetical protein